MEYALVVKTKGTINTTTTEGVRAVYINRAELEDPNLDPEIKIANIEHLIDQLDLFPDSGVMSLSKSIEIKYLESLRDSILEEQTSD